MKGPYATTGPRDDNQDPLAKSAQPTYTKVQSRRLLYANRFKQHETKEWQLVVKMLYSWCWNCRVTAARASSQELLAP